MKYASPQKAINAMCKACIYDSRHGNGYWTEQTEACTSRDCPLYELRPLSLETRDRLKEEKIAAMSPEQLVAYRNRQDSARERLATSR